ncbi:MAG: thiamine-phosphate kinase [Alphaproteobacteria bacterium]|nr:thiamine-phosphate kinase [Alphaproteobacteria bacterium]MDE2110571.1 thiamine-phosphate kinase [Alphaproteobacteria bacterium]MDE2492701.1 thiamine-phosphate kinase [Alphaproteobacteria bacterium]
MAKRPSEFTLIAQVFAPLATAPEAFGLLDDAAVLPPRPGHDLVVTTDALVEGVHFLAGDPPDTIAKKALRVNLSDLAAKGAEAAGYLLALSLPEHIDDAWIKTFARGLGEDQMAFGISLLGGDTTATPGPLTLAITALGYVPEGKMIHRGGAKAGDCVFVSGTIGDGGGGLAILNRENAPANAQEREELIRRYRVPTPRLTLGRALRNVATAALDVSDGLIADLAHIAEVSCVRIVIEAGRMPRSPALRALWGDSLGALVRAATSGDDYEIAFTAQSENSVVEAAKHAGVAVTRIGRVETGSGIALLDSRGCQIGVPRPGFTHF